MPEIQQTTPEERLATLAEDLEEQFGEMECRIEKANSALSRSVRATSGSLSRGTTKVSSE